MASSKSFITVFLLAVTLSSMSMSQGARHLLQTSTPNMPTLPKPTLPPLPSLPTLPQGNVPPLPTIPTLPLGSVPPLPTIPSLPQPSLPTIPQVTLPPLAATSLPTIPTTIPSFPFLSPPPSTTSP